jgi:hypothetical protein
MLVDLGVECEQTRTTPKRATAGACGIWLTWSAIAEGNGQQKVVVEHVHVYPGGQAIVGQVTPGGLGKLWRLNPMLLDMQKAPRCGAKTRSGKPCQLPGMPNGRCRMHGVRRPALRRAIRTP